MKLFKSGFVAIIALSVMSFTIVSKSKMVDNIFSNHKAVQTCPSSTYGVIQDLSNGGIVYTSGVSVCPSATDCYSFTSTLGVDTQCVGTGAFCCATKGASCVASGGNGFKATITCQSTN